MEKAYWLKRATHSREMARTAKSSEARLIHYDLAGRYGVNAAAADGPSALAVAALCADALSSADDA